MPSVLPDLIAFSTITISPRSFLQLQLIELRSAGTKDFDIKSKVSSRFIDGDD